LSKPSNEPEVLQLYDGLQVGQQQRTVTLRAEIPPDLLDKAIAKLQAFPAGSPPPRRR
jgi:phage FluMu protein gp41